MLLKKPCKVKRIHLLTTQDEVSHFETGDGRLYLPLFAQCCFVISHHSRHPLLQADNCQQRSALDEMKQSLSAQGVTLGVEYSSTIHDREIR